MDCTGKNANGDKRHKALVISGTKVQKYKTHGLALSCIDIYISPVHILPYKTATIDRVVSFVCI